MSGNDDQQNSSNRVAGMRMSRRNLAVAAAVLVAGTTGVVSNALAGNRNHHHGGGHGGGGGYGGGGGGGSGGGGGGGGGSGGPSCFMAGTLVRTPNGEVAIEDLKTGDYVITHSGATKPVREINVTPVTCTSGETFSPTELPVRISRGALGPDMPRRDLYLSSGHHLLLDGFLIPAGYLVNGRTIDVIEPKGVTQIDYYHLALEDHDVLMVEGCPCESFVGEGMAYCAPAVRFGGVKGKVMSRLRSAISPLVDIRTPADRVRDRLEVEAGLLQAA